MKKTEFIYEMMSKNVSIFTHRAALKSNIKEMIDMASEIYDEVEVQLKERAFDKK